MNREEYGNVQTKENFKQGKFSEKKTPLKLVYRYTVLHPWYMVSAGTLLFLVQRNIIFQESKKKTKTPVQRVGRGPTEDYVGG